MTGKGKLDFDLDWSDLVPLVEPILTADAQRAAKAYLVKVHIPEFKAGKAGERNPLWTQVLDKAKQVARERAAELVGKRFISNGNLVDNPSAKWAITQTTRDALNALVSQSIDEGWTTAQLQKQIIDSERFSPARALNISRTETAYARAHGTHEAAKETGMKFKEWFISGAEVCEECEANEEQGRIGVDDLFDSGVDCPPSHVNCRCALGYYETEDGD